MRTLSLRRSVVGSCAGLVAALFSPAGHSTDVLQGRVLDLNGRPVPQALVTLTRRTPQPGPTAVTVFTDENGRFQFRNAPHDAVLSARQLGYRMVDTSTRESGSDRHTTLYLRSDANQAGIAPASAWLASVQDPNDRTQLVMTCVACHQIPSPEVRHYAKLIDDVPATDEAEARRASWHAIVQYMNYLSAWEFGRGGTQGPPEPDHAYSGGEAGPTAALLARTLSGPMQHLEGYSWGAPVIATSRTVIREYEVPGPNAVREATTLDDPNTLWMADVSSNRVIRVDARTGALQDFNVPTDVEVGPHTLVRDRDGSLWVTPLFNGVIGRLQPKTGQWKVWKLKTQHGAPPGVHDLTFGASHDLLTDRRGRIWYSDIVHNAVGWFDPKTGQSGIHPIPPVPGRAGGEQTYGLVMSPDRKHIWYSQLGIGAFGAFDVETLEFEESVELPDRNSGPRRLAMSEDGVLYVPLYGSGQLVEYDTRGRKILGIHDLPDRASAPYAVTWDDKRKVVWIPTSNANAIYRFDPRDKSFGVLPLPREGAFLRMVAVDRTTGALVTSYANIVENVHGPRMAVVIDLGDEPVSRSRRESKR